MGCNLGVSAWHWSYALFCGVLGQRCVACNSRPHCLPSPMPASPLIRTCSIVHSWRRSTECCGMHCRHRHTLHPSDHLGLTCRNPGPPHQGCKLGWDRLQSAHQECISNVGGQGMRWFGARFVFCSVLEFPFWVKLFGVNQNSTCWGRFFFCDSVFFWR